MLDDDYASNEKKKKLGGRLKRKVESELKKRMERMEVIEMQEMMTDLIKEHKSQRTLKDQEEEDKIYEKTLVDELDLLTRFQAKIVGEIVTVRPRLVKSKLVRRYE